MNTVESFKNLTLEKKHFFIFFFIQIILLCIFFISASYLHNLFDSDFFLKGSNDSRYFYDVALKLFNRMQSEGVFTFEMFPQGQFLSGISALIFWIINSPLSWVIIVLASFLHLLTIFLYYKIFLLFFDAKKSFYGALFLQLNPIAATWFLQHHKESYTTLAFALILFVVLKKKKTILDFIFLSLSVLIFSLVKPYLLIFISFFVALLVIFNFIDNKVEKKYIINEILALVVILMLSCLLYRPSLSSSVLDESQNKNIKSFQYGVGGCAPLVNKFNAMRSWFYANHNGATTFDRDYVFVNCTSLFTYIPKAVYISYLSPNIFQMNFQGKTMKVKIETIFASFYMTLSSLFLLALLFFGNRKIWKIFLVTSPLILLFAYFLPNIGTIARYRAPFLMIFIGLGFCCLQKKIEDVAFERKKHKELK